jgi:hypothetical protein
MGAAPGARPAWGETWLGTGRFLDTKMSCFLQVTKGARGSVIRRRRDYPASDALRKRQCGPH